MTRTRSLRAGLLAIALTGLVACGETSASAPPATIASIAAGHQMLTPADADRLLSSPPAGLIIVDVRTPAEFAAGHISGAVDIDLNSPSFAAQISALDSTATYFVYCHSGRRSAQAVALMQQAGFGSIYELEGGIAAWEQAGLPTVTG